MRSAVGTSKDSSNWPARLSLSEISYKSYGIGSSRTRYYQRVQNGITHIDNAHVKYEVQNSGVVINQIAFFRNEIMSLYDLSNPKLCVIDIVNEYLCNDALSALESSIDGLASDYGISPDYVRDIVSRSTCDEQRYWACKYMDWLTMNYKVKNNETMHYVDKYTNEAEKYNYDIIVTEKIEGIFAKTTRDYIDKCQQFIACMKE